MKVQTLTVAGTKFAVIPFEDYRQLLRGVKIDESDLPALPKPLPGGNYRALGFMRASIARDIIKGRRAQALSQAELARRAGIQPAVLNRIEKAKVDAESVTIDRILRALDLAKKRRRRVG